ncbi:unannotated protein [freshwater metagenome]|uniref:Unannotated protein n=1 Tax=freshwater metagenome TaxID=449393 RepID=A0A6J6HYS6_9ZZZZ|nr:hypothetical protein [Actinomycetota bacterium]
MVSFQDVYGLDVSGECDEQTWSALIEASWKLGERLLYVRTQNIRGDDVAELQSQLNRLGFNCDRVDGIYGPRTAAAVSEFQRNLGIKEDGISTPEFIDVLIRMGLQSGAGPGVAVVRESMQLGTSTAHTNARLAIGFFAGGAPLAQAILRRCRETYPLTTSVDADASVQANAANSFDADAYIGCEMTDDIGCIISYYEVPTFVSAGGRNLALRIAAAISDRVPELAVHTQGVRHQVLRETRMPAVMCSMAPASVVSLKTSALSSAIHDAFGAWRDNPSLQL